MHAEFKFEIQFESKYSHQNSYFGHGARGWVQD